MQEMNTAQQLRSFLNLPTHQADNQKPKSYKKKGPGRNSIQGDGSHSDLTIKQRRAGMYGKGLRNWITQKNAANLVTKSMPKG